MTRLTVAFSTSSPLASVAILDGGSQPLWSGRELAPNHASCALPKLLEEGLRFTGLKLADAELFASDLGPGSFTGVRVGVVFAKSLAYAQGAYVCGASAFDLIDPGATVFVPSRRGEVYVRQPGHQPTKMEKPPEGAIGYEFGASGAYPDAAGFAALLAGLARVSPVDFVPAYLTEPAISLPKTPYSVPNG